MSLVKIGEFKFGEDAFTLRYVLGNEQIVKFVAKDVASALKYEKTANAITTHVDDKYKSKFEQDTQIRDVASNTLAKQGDPLYLHPHTILVTKEGVIQLIMKSKLPYAVELQAWLLEEVIPQVLCTGKYQPAIAMDTDMDVLRLKTNMIELTSELKASNEIIKLKFSSPTKIWR
ncbi:BRO [Orgyia pseudotsugata single capsid nuclopolyhedrovirus]|nr:BRO [Orgyia pseudotsugata single capsid nuclopolyhedrovirus]